MFTHGRGIMYLHLSQHHAAILSVSLSLALSLALSLPMSEAPGQGACCPTAILKSLASSLLPCHAMSCPDEDIIPAAGQQGNVLHVTQPQRAAHMQVNLEAG